MSAQKRGQASVMEPAQEQAVLERERVRRRWAQALASARRCPSVAQRADSDCSCRRDQRRLWMVPRNVTRKYNLSRLRVQQFVAIVPVIVAEVKKIAQAGTKITLVQSGHSVVGRLERWQQRQRRAVPINDFMGRKPSVICRASRPIKAFRGPQQ